MSLGRTLSRVFGFAAAFALVGQGGALGQSAFPQSTLQPSPYTGTAARAPAPAAAAPIIAPTGGAQTVRIDLGGPGTQSRMLALPRGKSAVIELPVDARDVLVSDPKVADVVLSTPRRIYVLGVGAGQTDAVFFDAAGRQLLNLNIRVDQDISALSQTLGRVLPGSGIRVEALNNNLILSGNVASLSDADKALQMARSMVAKPEQVINMLSIDSPEQVMLKVRIVEVNRTVIKQLGFNLNAIYNQIGEPQLKLAQSPTFGVNGSLLGGVSAGYNLNTAQNPITSPVDCDFSVTPANCSKLPFDIIDRNYRLSGIHTGPGSPNLNQAEAMLQAFERVGLVRTLAEPNLTTTSGEGAKFLAGGEFPVPVGRDNNGLVTIQFKPYGVGLGFTPVVLSEGRISLKISTEYSEITNIGALTVGNGGTTGVTVPGLTVRRAETLVELPSGGAMMIAGLLQTVTKSTIDSLPGLMQLPVLGTLFRSRDFLNNESELVVIVTPYLVKATSPDKLQTPADGLQIASDLQTVLLGRLNKASGRTPDKAAGAFQGPYGYVVD